MLEHALTTPATSVPASVLEATRSRLLDIAGCAFVGRLGEGCSGLSALLRSVVGTGGVEGSVTAPDGGGRLPVASAAFVGAVQARSFDFGVLTPVPQGREVWSHISETTAPTALAVGEWAGSTVEETLATLALADDVTARVSRASAFVPGQHWDSPGLVNRIGSTLIAARFMGLDVPTTAHAVGLAVQHMGSTFHPIDQGALAFKLGQGLAARDGVLCAMLADTGWTASTDPLLGRIGYADVFADGLDEDLLVDGLGTEYLGDEIYKPYPGCRFTHSSVDASLELREEVQAGEIDEITIDVAPMHAVPLLARDPADACTSQVGALFSLQYQVANALVRGTPTPEHFFREAITDPQVTHLVGLTSVQGALPPGDIKASRLTVRTKDGRTLVAETPSALGDPTYRRMTVEAIDAKLTANLRSGGTRDDEAATLARDLRTAAAESPIGQVTEALHALASVDRPA